jgi:hypothetical protein
VTLDADLAAIRAVARQLRATNRPVEARRCSALAASLDHSARGLGRGVEFLRAEAEGRRPPVVELGDPDTYRGLDVAQAARLLVERCRGIGQPLAPGPAVERINRELAQEVDGFVAAVAASGRRTALLARPVPLAGSGGDGPGEAPTAGSRAARKAAALLVEPRPGTKRRAVLDAVAAVARDVRTVGLTDVEIQRATGLSPNSARPRRVELVNGGWLADSGRTREHFGREHTVWVLTEKAARLVSGPPATA